jgi:hypothetical protein
VDDDTFICNQKCEQVTDGVISPAEEAGVLPFGVNCCLTKFKCTSALLTLLFFKAEVTSSNSTFTD